ncbi:MAG: hypothetical protein LBS74_01090 [Oscillospiraceae bacterium]|jgi:hypothetical protein|nr:hypothetical protein [Oscillospiraceae bacterium]
MSPKKIRQLLILNAVIIAVNIALFSRAFLGLSLFTGTALAVSLAWTDIIISITAFVRGNMLIMKKEETHMLTQGIRSLDDCVGVFQEAINNGDVFDESILKNIDQIKRFKRKQNTIKDILLQKFSPEEMSFKKFNGVLAEVQEVFYLNMRSILNKISAFDVDEYERLVKTNSGGDELTQAKMEIYSEFISFVNNATKINEEILIKLDKMLLEISKYNSLEDGDINKLAAIIEMDELIKNAGLYR